MTKRDLAQIIFFMVLIAGLFVGVGYGAFLVNYFTEEGGNGDTNKNKLSEIGYSDNESSFLFLNNTEGDTRDYILIQRAGETMFRLTYEGDAIFNGSITIGNGNQESEGTIRWTGDDFEGFDGNEWVSFTGGAKTFAQLEDTPSTYANNAGEIIAIDASGTGLEYISLPDAIDEAISEADVVQSLSLVGNVLFINGVQSDIDLAQFLDNTDAQELSLDGLNLSISGGNTIDLSSIPSGGSFTNLGDTPASYVGSAGYVLKVNGGGTGLEFVNDAAYLDNTDSQSISLSTNTLSISGNASTVDLSSYLDNTDSQAISLLSNTLSITGDAGTVDLSPYLDNTDAQVLSLSTNTLSITGSAPTIDLSGYLDNTDAQTLSLVGTDLTISGGNTVDLSSLSGGATAFTSLTDTPGSFAGSELYAVRVNAGGTALEFVDFNSIYFAQGGNSFGTTAIIGTNDANNVAIETGGTTRVTIDSTGNVGIGTETPAEKLDVDGNVQLSGDLLTSTPLTTSDPVYTDTIVNDSSGVEVVQNSHTDVNGNLYITGNFSGTADFDPTAGVDSHASNGGYDVYLSKYDVNGNYLWTQTFGGTSDDYGQAISTNAAGDVYVGGRFVGTVDFDPGAGTNSLASNGNSDMFISKFDTDGVYGWTSVFGSSSPSAEYLYSLAVDSAGYIYSTGAYAGTTDFDPGAGVASIPTAGSYDIYVLKLDSTGQYVWAYSAGGTSSDTGYMVNVDASDNVYIGGTFQTTADFDYFGGTSNLVSNGGNDVYLVKLDSSGNLIWANSLGGTSNDAIEDTSVVYNSDNSIFIGGAFQDTVDFEFGGGVTNKVSNGGFDVYILKVSLDGVFSWVNTIGSNSTGNEGIRGVDQDSAGNILIAGIFRDTVDLDGSAGVDNYASNGLDDVFLAKYSSDGVYQYGHAIGGASSETMYVSTATNNTMFTPGYYFGTVDFDPTVATDSSSSNGGGADIFISRFTQGLQGSNIGSSTNPFAGVYSYEYFGKNLNIANFDLAEEYEVEDSTIGPGDVVRFKKSSTNKLVVERAGGAGRSYDNETIGVISTEPGLYLKDWAADKENGRPVALAGRVPVKVSLENGPINRGDFLTTASKPGFAMKASGGGLIIGRAMEDFNPGSSGDSALVDQEIAEDLEVVDEILVDSVNSGEISTTDQEELAEKFTVEVVEKQSTSEFETGRIMMYVDLGFVGQSEFEEEVVIDEGLEILESGTDTISNYFELLKGDEGKVKINVAGDLNVQGSVAATSFTGPNGQTIVDLNNNGFRVYSISGEQLFGVTSAGKLELYEGSGSSLGSAIVPAGQTQFFVEKTSITANSKIFVEFLESITYDIGEKVPGSGFNITIPEPQESDLEFNYLILN